MTVSFMYGLVSSISSELPQLEPGKERRSERLGYIYASDGKTVLADALILLGVRYGTPEAAALAGRWMAAIQAAAYQASADQYIGARRRVTKRTTPSVRSAAPMPVPIAPTTRFLSAYSTCSRNYG